jgi:hypothetical protein
VTLNNQKLHYAEKKHVILNEEELIFEMREENISEKSEWFMPILRK